MKEMGRIIRIEGRLGIVELSPRGGCKNCAMNYFCHSTGMGKHELALGLGGKECDPGDVTEIPDKRIVIAAGEGAKAALAAHRYLRDFEKESSENFSPKMNARGR